MNIINKIQSKLKKERPNGYYATAEKNWDEHGGYWVYKKKGEAYFCQFCFCPELDDHTFTSRKELIDELGKDEVEIAYDYGRPNSEADIPDSKMVRITQNEYKELRKYLKKKAKEMWE